MNTKLTIIALAFSALTAQAQKTIAYTHADKLYFDGREQMDQRNYAVAFRHFNEYIENQNEAERNTFVAESEFYRAVCAYNMGYYESGRMLDQFLISCPCSPHASKARLLRGITYYNKDKFIEASDSCFTKIDDEQLSPEDRDLYHFHYGYSLLQQQKYSEAKVQFNQVDNKNSSYGQAAQYYAAYIDYSQQHYDNALPTFLALQNNQEYAHVVPYYIAQIYYSKGMYDKVLEYGLGLVEANPTNENNAEIYRLIGESYYQRKDYNNTIKYLSLYEQRIKRIYRSDAYMLGVAYYNANNYKEAIPRLQKATVQTDDAMAQNAYLYLGSSYIKLNDKNSARLAFESASKLNFDKNVKEEALYNYALLVYEQSYSPFNESVTAFESFLDQFPESKYNERVFNYLVNVYLTTKNYQAAYASIQRIKNPSPSVKAARQRVLFCMGIQEFNNNDLNKANEWLTKSLEDRQSSYDLEAQALYWRGESFYRMGDYDKATSDFTDFVNCVGARKTDVFNLGHYSLGYSYFAKKDYKNALTWFRKYVNLEDKNVTLQADASNRVGDCYYNARDFANAMSSYGKVFALNGPGADYACFQQGFIQGLQKNYTGKIATLEKLLNTYKQSEYQPDAIYEIGLSHIMLGENEKAITRFTELNRTYFHSPLARKGRLQIAMLYDDMGKTDDAIKAYKQIVDLYPQSEEASTSLESLKQIYVEKNSVSDYAEYINSLGGLATFSATEEDSLTYVAAEKLYTKGDYAQAAPSLKSFNEKFPNSPYRINAHYALANSYLKLGDNDRAKEEYVYVSEQPGVWQAGVSLVRLSEIYFTQKEFISSVNASRKVIGMTQKTDVKAKAQLNIMRCFNELGEADSTIEAADAIIKGNNIEPANTREALYLQAKAYEKLEKTIDARANYTKLAANTMDEYGAEAKYLIGVYHYHDNNLDAAEKEVFSFIEMNTPHQYWLAKSFILLSDIYLNQGKNYEAKQFLLSLQENYDNTNDNIGTEIKARLYEIESREAKQVKQ
ncbi:MAG: tetratricopeptide repeat protein [Paludibacteraceae bacterium]|nr:tetratricopeptide repeat protein [Paludibacteraceae bacterium]